MSQLVPSLLKSMEATTPVGILSKDIARQKVLQLVPSLSESTGATTQTHDVQIIISDDEEWSSDNEAVASPRHNEVGTRAIKKSTPMFVYHTCK